MLLTQFCEAYILKENVYLRAQLEFINTNYGILEEIHESSQAPMRIL
jgi:hypothetical protein